MQWFEAERLPLSMDLEPVLRSLQASNVPCWISEDSGEQIIWLQSPQHRMVLTQTLESHANGGLDAPIAMALPLVESNGRGWRDLPVTIAAIFLSVLGAWLIYVDESLHWVHWLTFTDVHLRGSLLYFTDLRFVLQQHEYWRVFTPTFLHFGLFHILFNSLWLWEMGRRIERRRGSMSLIFITLFTGVGANLLQYAMSGPSFFGGMSGVLYGYLGYIWMWQRYQPSDGFELPSGIIGFMLLWLVLCFTGVVDNFIDGQVANGAHLGGLLCGICIGLLGVLVRKLNGKKIN